MLSAICKTLRLSAIHGMQLVRTYLQLVKMFMRLVRIYLDALRIYSVPFKTLTLHLYGPHKNWTAISEEPICQCAHAMRV